MCYWPGTKQSNFDVTKKRGKLMPWGIRLNFQLLMCLPVNLVHNRVDWHINILVNPSVLPEWVTMGRGHVADEKEGTKNGVVPTQNVIFLHSDSLVCILLLASKYLFHKGKLGIHLFSFLKRMGAKWHENTIWWHSQFVHSTELKKWSSTYHSRANAFPESTQAKQFPAIIFSWKTLVHGSRICHECWKVISST